MKHGRFSLRYYSVQVGYVIIYVVKSFSSLQIFKMSSHLLHDVSCTIVYISVYIFLWSFYFFPLIYVCVPLYHNYWINVYRLFSFFLHIVFVFVVAFLLIMLCLVYIVLLSVFKRGTVLKHLFFNLSLFLILL